MVQGAGGGDGAVVVFGYALADGEADAGAFIFHAVVEALEHFKNAVAVLVVEANAFVFQGAQANGR